MDAETVLTPQKALECGLIDKIGVEQKEEPRTEQLLAENEQLIKQLNNRTFLDAEVKKFMRTVAPAQKQKSGFDAFFQKVKNSSLQRQKNLFLQAGARMTGR